MNDKSRMCFAENLKKLRKSAGLSRKALAAQISYSEKSIEKWEMSKSVPPVSVLCELAELFHVSLDALVYPWNEEICYFLGIDGGGTKTAFVLRDRNGNTVRQVTLGASNPNDVGMEKCRQILEMGISEVCDRLDRRQISLFAGLAGAGVSDNAKVIKEFLAELGFGRAGCGWVFDTAVSYKLENDLTI